MLIVTITPPMIFCLKLVTVMYMDQIIPLSHGNCIGILFSFDSVMLKLD